MNNNIPADPNELKKQPRYIRAWRWRIPWELYEWYAQRTLKPFDQCCNVANLTVHLKDRGTAQTDTAVTTGRRDLLLRALAHTEKFREPVAEVGSWRGVTTAALAGGTSRTVYAVDPYNGYVACDQDMELMLQRTKNFPNRKQVRMGSGPAALSLSQERFSLIFIDAIHDYMNTWFDFHIWGRQLIPGGLFAFHDVDDHAGSNLACRRINRVPGYKAWGYCPNLVVFEKLS